MRAAHSEVSLQNPGAGAVGTLGEGVTGRGVGKGVVGAGAGSVVLQHVKLTPSVVGQQEPSKSVQFG